jgi:hypothetical protein
MIVIALVRLKETSNAQRSTSNVQRPTKKKIGLAQVTVEKIFAKEMSRFPIRYCVKEYEIILSRKRKTTAYASGNQSDRAGDINPNISANHHQL